MTQTIDWTKPLELTDGTPVKISRYYSDGDFRLKRVDGSDFTSGQAKGNYDAAIWHPDGRRLHNNPGLNVQNRPEPPEGWTAYDGTNKPADDRTCHVHLRSGSNHRARPVAHWEWSQAGRSGDIIGFRLEPAKPPQWALEEAMRLTTGEVVELLLARGPSPAQQIADENPTPLAAAEAGIAYGRSHPA